MEQNSLVEKLTLQSESFQEGFEILCKSFSFDEMARNFLHLLRGNFISTKIHLFYKTTKDSDWNSIQSQEKFSDADFSLLSLNNLSPIKYLKGEKYTAVVVLPLSDYSFLGILIGGKLDGSELNDFDKITLQILLQVFDSAHKSFINQINEKKLIFDLNEKVLQLNSLIDTGIELSRYDNKNILFDLALGRVVTLTNASSAGIIIKDAENNSIEERIAFPSNIDVNGILNSPHKIECSFEFNDRNYLLFFQKKKPGKA